MQSDNITGEMCMPCTNACFGNPREIATSSRSEASKIYMHCSLGIRKEHDVRSTPRVHHYSNCLSRLEAMLGVLLLPHEKAYIRHLLSGCGSSYCAEQFAQVESRYAMSWLWFRINQ